MNTVKITKAHEIKLKKLKWKYKKAIQNNNCTEIILK